MGQLHGGKRANKFEQGPPPSPSFRAMPERKRFYLCDVFPKSGSFFWWPGPSDRISSKKIEKWGYMPFWGRNCQKLGKISLGGRHLWNVLSTSKIEESGLHFFFDAAQKPRTSMKEKLVVCFWPPMITRQYILLVVMYKSLFVCVPPLGQ